MDSDTDRDPGNYQISRITSCKLISDQCSGDDSYIHTKVIRDNGLRNLRKVCVLYLVQTTSCILWQSLCHNLITELILHCFGL